MDGGAWWTAVHGVAKSRTRLSDFTFAFHFYALEKEMATHSSSCLENPRDGGAWWAAVYGVAQSRTRLKQLSSSSSSNKEYRFKTDYTLRKILPFIAGSSGVKMNLEGGFVQWFWLGSTSLVAQLVKNPPASAGDTGSIPDLGRSHVPRSN